MTDSTQLTTGAAHGDVEIVPLDPGNWPTLAELFEQGGDPKTCWCAFWRFTNAASAGMGRDENRAWLEGKTNADPPVGLVALSNGAAVGWVSLGPREGFHRLGTSRTIPQLDGEGVWSVVCFVVSRAMRRQGLTARLLAAAVDSARGAGARVLEAYPVATADGKVPPSAAYTGLESTFLDAGFTRVAVTTSKAGGQPRVVVRRSL